MSYGPYSANIIQFGRETTAGGAVNATEIWLGPAIDIEDDRTREEPGVEESTGVLVPGERTYDPKLGALLNIPETEATFEQLPHLFEMGVKTVTPTGLGPYQYRYNWPLTAGAANTLKSYTVQTGNIFAGDANRMPYGLVTEIQMSGRFGEAWTVGASLMGQKKDVAALAPANLSPIAVEEMLFGNTKLYIDEPGAVATPGDVTGATQLLGVMVAADIRIQTGVRAVPVGDGNLYYTKHKMTRPSITMALTMELEDDNGYVAAERAKYAAQTMRMIHLTCAGTGGRNMTIALAGKWMTVGSYSDEDGNTTVQFEASAKHGLTDSFFAQFDITNTRSSLTSNPT